MKVANFTHGIAPCGEIARLEAITEDLLCEPGSGDQEHGKHDNKVGFHCHSHCSPAGQYQQVIVLPIMIHADLVFPTIPPRRVKRDAIQGPLSIWYIIEIPFLCLGLTTVSDTNDSDGNVLRERANRFVSWDDLLSAPGSAMAG